MYSDVSKVCKLQHTLSSSSTMSAAIGAQRPMPPSVPWSAGVQRLNHGIGFSTAAIELLLPTFGERLGLKGKIATHFALNPHPALIPAIEFGLGEADPFLRFRGWHGGLCPCPTGHLLHRSGRIAPLQPRLLPDGGPVCLRHVIGSTFVRLTGGVPAGIVSSTNLWQSIAPCMKGYVTLMVPAEPGPVFLPFCRCAYRKW